MFVMDKGSVASKTPIYRAKSRPSLPTAKPELKKKSFIDLSICGWIGGNYDIPALCQSGSVCVRDTIHKYVGCCQASGSCSTGIYTSCIDENHHDWSEPKGVQTNGVYTCSRNSQCYQNTYADGYSQYGCGESIWATTVETTFAGQQSDMSLQLIFTSVTFSAMQTDSTTMPSPTLSLESSPSYLPVFSINSTVLPSSWTPNPTSSFIAPPPASPSSMMPKGPTASTLAGIVIGSVNGAFILTGLAICLYLRRRNRLRRAATRVSSDQGTKPQPEPTRDTASTSKYQRISPLQCVSPLQNPLPLSMRLNDSPPAYQYAEVAIPAPYNLPHSQSSMSPRSPVLEFSPQLMEHSQDTGAGLPTPNSKTIPTSMTTNSAIGIAVSSEKESLLGAKPDESPIFEEFEHNSHFSQASDLHPSPEGNSYFDGNGPTSFLDDDDTISDDSQERSGYFAKGLGPRYKPVNQENSD